MHRQIKTYVMRAGRISPRQQEGLDSWLNAYELTVEGSSPWSLSEVFGRNNDTIVEVGFGMGDSLLTMAIDHPEINYLGIEVHRSGVGSLAAGLHQHQLTNVRIVAHDAVEVFHQHVADNSLAGIQIFFPDPWHKKRHHKRRLIQPEFVKLITQKLRPQGFIHYASDWQDYAEHSLQVFSNEPNLRNQQQDGGYAPRPDSRPLTKFEQRGQRLGHGVWDLIFVKRDAL